MSDGNVIFLFEGKRTDQLGFWDFIRYEAALSRSYRGLSGNLDGAKLSANGITIELVNQQNQGGNDEKR
jgi:hypothetical protein